MTSDYNRGTATASREGGPRGWLPGWAWALLLGAAGFVAMLPLDQTVFAAARRLEASLPSDLRREWSAWQQYGQGVAIVFVALLIWTLDPRRRRRLLDLALATALAQVVSSAGKILVARPRPRDALMDAQSFPGPWGVYPLQRGGEWRLMHGWEAGADLWSMPSSHALFAAMVSAFVGVVYPRAWWVVGFATVVVGVGRVVFGAHWPSDVVVGWALGWAIGAAVTRHGLGVRLLDRAWRGLVDSQAEPSWPRVRDASQDAGVGRG